MSILIGFSFNNVHSSSVGLYVDTPSRVIKPGLRTNRYIIPGRSGTLDYNSDTYNDITITCNLSFKADSLVALRDQQRAVSDFLAASGPLVFDDEPGKAYQAKIIDSVSLDQLVRVGTAFVTFTCQPFAESVEYRQISASQHGLPLNLYPEMQGTQEAPCIIRITAETNIDSLIVSRTRLD